MKTGDKNLDLIIDFLSESTPPDNTRHDVIFVLGHYARQVADHAAMLWRTGVAPRILITGGVRGRPLIPPQYETEADYYQQLVVEGYVPVSQIILERRAENTLDNVKFGMAEWNRQQGSYPKSVVVVALPFLLRRALATFRKNFPNVLVRGEVCNLDVEFLNSGRIQRILEELPRLVRYARKGDIVPVDIPPEVWAAAAALGLDVTHPKK